MSNNKRHQILTFTTPQDVADAAKDAARADYGTFSHFVRVALIKELQARGRMPKEAVAYAGAASY